jgi:aryl-alcohol dehydrogenase-like predicted oxidoreductase
METRRLGKTDLLVSRMGLGLAALGRPGYINLGHAEDLQQQYNPDSMEAHAHGVLDAARQAGVRYFDAARSYGCAESFLSTWLSSRQLCPGAVTIGSKWGYAYTAGWKVEAEKHEVKEHSLTVLQRQIVESRQLLGDHLRLYQVHSATLDSGILENRQVLEELACLRDTGLKIGLTLTGPRQAETLMRAMDVVIGGHRLFDTVQATWNLLEKSAGPQLRTAHEAGMGIIIKEALANGRLTPKNLDSEFASRRRLLDEVAERLHTTLDALALAAVLAQPWVDVVLSGAATVEHLASNLAALHVRWDDEAAESLRALEESPHEYWSTRSGLAWN